MPPAGKRSYPRPLLTLRSAIHESIGVTLFACLYGWEPATPLDILCRFPSVPATAGQYVGRLEDHQLRAHRLVQEQLAQSLQGTAQSYGNEKDDIQLGEWVWVFTAKPSSDQKLAIPLRGPWRVSWQDTSTLSTIHPEGDWCRKKKPITVSLNWPVVPSGDYRPFRGKTAPSGRSAPSLPTRLSIPVKTALHLGPAIITPNLLHPGPPHPPTPAQKTICPQPPLSGQSPQTRATTPWEHHLILATSTGTPRGSFADASSHSSWVGSTYDCSLLFPRSSP